MTTKDSNRRPGGPGRGIGGWDNQAEFYNKMAAMEAEMTLNQIDCLDLDETMTVLDVGCGPGRISVPTARRVKSVTALSDVQKLSKLAKKWAVMMIWSFGSPSIPAITNNLFEGTVPKRPGPPMGPGKDRSQGNNALYNRVKEK